MNHEKRKQQVLASGLALIVVASLVTSVSLIAIQPARAQTPINSCTTITQPGEYVLTQDIENATGPAPFVCIEIESSDVTFDGNGHTIDGSAGAEAIIVGNPPTKLTNITIKNVIVSDWNFEGIAFVDTLNSSLENSTVTNTGDNGILFTRNSSNNTITNNTVIENEEGIAVRASSNNNLVSNNSVVRTDSGVSIVNASNNTVSNNELSELVGGISIERSSQNNTASNNTISQIRTGLFVFDNSENNTVINNSINNTTENPFFFSDGIGVFSDNNTFVNNTITGVTNDSAGFFIGNFTGNIIYNNFMNNTNNVRFVDDFVGTPNTWNVSNQSGPNIIGGPNLGGNYYATPAGDGFSQTCTDANNDGFCDEPNNFGIDNNNTDFLPLTQANGQQQPNIDVSPTSLNFGKVTVGDSETKNVTVTNTGTGTLDVSATDIVGADASAFSVADGSAPFNLAPGESQNVTIEFAPTSKSTKTATLQIESNDPDEPTTTVELCGKGVKEGQTVFPDPLVIKKHGKVLFKIGPPQDLNRDGLYEDVNGDDKFTFKDVAALAIVENAYQHDHLDLNSQQVAALDFNHDGKLTQKDVVALAIDLFKEKTGWHSQLKGSDLNKDGTMTARDRSLGQALLNGRDLVKMLSVNGC